MNRWTAFVAVLCLTLALPAAADPITPWSTHTGKRFLGVNPIVSVGLDGYVTPTVYLSYGPGEMWDFIVGGGPTLGPASDGVLQGGYVEALVRQFFRKDPDVCIAINLSYGSDDGFGLGGQLHVAGQPAPWFQMVFNTGATVYPTSWGYVSTYVHAIAAPELILGPVGIFVEVMPAVYMPGYGWPAQPALTLTPGIGTWLGPDDDVSVSVGIALPIADPDTAPAIMVGVFTGGSTLKQ